MRTSIADDGWTEANLNFRPRRAKMQTNPDTHGTIPVDTFKPVGESKNRFVTIPIKQIKRAANAALFTII